MGAILWSSETIEYPCSGCAGEFKTLSVEAAVVAHVRGVKGRPLVIRTRCPDCGMRHRVGDGVADPDDLGTTVDTSPSQTKSSARQEDPPA